MSDAVITCRALARSYAGIGPPVEVLASVELEVMAGESIAIVGASGSGKSTLLHLMGGLDRASGGQVLINGHDPAGMSDSNLCAMRNEVLGFVYQFHHLLPEFTAL
ncbi:MAG: ATP-binding cassette domain-containing protein, partial [Gammaproteobacteria bacterium]|nr:ATP-binding cassette domain-containing protein [Gammaproteobacteria bacterium]